MVHIYIGDGKGKTSAALGIALRASGFDKKIYIAQFLKNNRFPSGEIKALKKTKLAIKIQRFRSQVHPMFVHSRKVNRKKLRSSLEAALKKVESYIDTKKFDIIILDEIFSAVMINMVSVARIKKIIKKSKDIELILTGPTAPQELFRIADYVSVIKKLKHPFDRNLYARQGIEY